MTALELFTNLGPVLGPTIEQHFNRRDNCIFATRCAVEIGRYFGVDVRPLAVRAAIYNAPFAKHVEHTFLDVDVDKWKPIDGSHSVGIGFGAPRGVEGYDGHLIALGDGAFGDFSINQVERADKGIETGPAIVGTYADEKMWRCEHTSSGTVVEYLRTDDLPPWRNSPDWRETHWRKRIVGAIIRELR